MKKKIILLILGLIISNLFWVGVVRHYQKKTEEARIGEIKAKTELKKYKERSFTKKALDLFGMGGSPEKK